MTASNRVWFVGPIAFFLSVGARADPVPPLPTEEQITAARALYREARDLEREGKPKEALEKALAAYKTAPTPVTALEAARLLVEQQQLIDARDIARAVALLVVGPRETDKGREARDQAAALADAIDARIPKIAIGGRPAGVDVLLDGKPIPADAMAWQGIDPGLHGLELRFGNHTCATLQVALGEGEDRTVDLREASLACLPKAPEAVPVAPVPMQHAVLARMPDESAADAHAAHPWRPVAGVVAGLGVVSFGIGSYLALSAQSDYRSVDSQCTPDCTRPAFNTRTSARSRADVATVVMISGAAVAGAGVILWLGDPGHSRPRVALGPTSVALVVPLR